MSTQDLTSSGWEAAFIDGFHQEARRHTITLSSSISEMWHFPLQAGAWRMTDMTSPRAPRLDIAQLSQRVLLVLRIQYSQVPLLRPQGCCRAIYSSKPRPSGNATNPALMRGRCLSCTFTAGDGTFRQTQFLSQKDRWLSSQPVGTPFSTPASKARASWEGLPYHSRPA